MKIIKLVYFFDITIIIILNKLKLTLISKNPSLLHLANRASCLKVFMKTLPQYNNKNLK